MSSPTLAVQPDLSLPRLITVRELAGRLALNEFTVYHWITQSPERLPRVTRFHGRVLFLESDVRDWFGTLHSKPAVKQPDSDQADNKRKRGRPTKVELKRRREAALLEGDSAGAE